MVVLTNPPLTSGERTLRRVALAADLLGFAEFDVVNIFALPSHATGEIASLGATEAGWVEAQPSIEAAVGRAHGALLAYGTTAPTGDARSHFRKQVSWVEETLARRSIPVWIVGDGPRHPSRWHRWTYRTFPQVPFTDALGDSFVQIAGTETPRTPPGPSVAVGGSP